MAGIAEYVDRTIDLVAYHGVQPRGRVRLEQTLAGPGGSGAILTGVLKVAQRFTVELLTERGSRLFRDEEGTDFMTEVRLGRLRTQADALAAFYRAVSDIRELLQSEELDTDPDDERFRNAEPQVIEVGSGTITIVVLLTTAAGTERDVIFPIAISL